MISAAASVGTFLYRRCCIERATETGLHALSDRTLHRLSLRWGGGRHTAAAAVVAAQRGAPACAALERPRAGLDQRERRCIRQRDADAYVEPHASGAAHRGARLR